MAGSAAHPVSSGHLDTLDQLDELASHEKQRIPSGRNRWHGSITRRIWEYRLLVHIPAARNNRGNSEVQDLPDDRLQTFPHDSLQRVLVLKIKAFL